MLLTRNSRYTRRQIQKIVGGEIQSYLPQKDGVIVAGCFSEDMNPTAPKEVFVGNLPKVVSKAKLLSQQPDNIFPVFVRPTWSKTEYYFRGYYRCVGISDDKRKIAEAEALSKRSGELAYIIFLQEDQR